MVNLVVSKMKKVSNIKKDIKRILIKLKQYVKIFQTKLKTEEMNLNDIKL